MNRKDIVYFVKDTRENEELRYSLRSVEKNFPHGKVWFFGGCPDGLRPDIYIPVKQTQSSKYYKVRNMVKLAIEREDLSENFWLFNDDFFVMSKVAYLLPTIDGSLLRKIQKIEKKYGGETSYTFRLRNTDFALRDMEKDRLNYELHIPMEINKDKAANVLRVFSDNIAFRSAYGNYYNLAKAIHPDVKVLGTEGVYDPDLHNMYLSTSDKSFRYGHIGEYIRKKFTEPSRFEVGNSWL